MREFLEIVRDFPGVLELLPCWSTPASPFSPSRWRMLPARCPAARQQCAEPDRNKDSHRSPDPIRGGLGSRHRHSAGLARPGRRGTVRRRRALRWSSASRCWRLSWTVEKQVFSDTSQADDIIPVLSTTLVLHALHPLPMPKKVMLWG